MATPNIRWRRVGAFWYGIAVGGGAVHVYNASTNAYLYTCLCSTTGGSGPRWRSIPRGKRCPPMGVPSDVCP